MRNDALVGNKMHKKQYNNSYCTLKEDSTNFTYRKIYTALLLAHIHTNASIHHMQEYGRLMPLYATISKDSNTSLLHSTDTVIYR